MANGDSTIGWGHVCRCTALIGYLKAYFEITFVSNCNSQVLINEIIKGGASFVPVSFELEASLNIAENHIASILDESEVIVLDGKAFTEAIRKRLKDAGKLLVVIADHFVDIAYCDILINYQTSATKKNFANGLTRLFGLEYALVNNAFEELKDADAKKSGVIINFGGADKDRLAVSLSEALAEQTDMDIILLSPFESKHGISRFWNLSSSELAVLYSKADVVICTVGVTLLEAVKAGAKTIGCYFTANQKANYNRYVANKMCYPLGFLDGNLSNVLKALKTQRNSDWKGVPSFNGEKIGSLAGQIPKHILSALR